MVGFFCLFFHFRFQWYFFYKDPEQSLIWGF